MLSRHWLVLALLLAPALASADDDEVMNHPVFVAAHPDMYWRQLGQEALKAGDAREAYGHFRKSAGYADKASQAMVAEMLWNGSGVSQDRPLAYAWMDLAGERGYRDLVVAREKYWAALTPSERERAVAVGDKVYAEFGDAVAKPRMNTELQRERRKVTGSRLGHVGSVRIPGSIDARGTHPVMDAASLGDVTQAAVLFADKYWVPELYWQWQDEMWKRGESAQGAAPRTP
ncbi:MAG: sel1 repeat family protein [Xanthomonadales bacterium]|nr:sel1 repeat family protein [Xanthomonadales bacterium]